MPDTIDLAQAGIELRHKAALDQGQFLIAEKPHALSGRPMVMREVGLPQLRQGVSLTLEGTGPFWLSQDIVGYTTSAPAPSVDGIRIRRVWYRTDGTLFTGDSLFPGGPGRTLSPEDFGSLMDDLEAKVFARFDDRTVVHPGHGDDTTLGAERPHLAEWRARGW